MPSRAFISAVAARVNDEVLLTFVHIAHDDIDRREFPHCIRVYDGGRSAEDVLRVGGIDYTPWAFRWRRPDRRSDRLIQVPIEIDNVDARIMRAVLKLTEPAEVRIWTALASSPEVIEEGPLNFELQRVVADRLTLRAQLGLEPMLWMRYGRIAFDPARFPGLFR